MLFDILISHINQVFLYQLSYSKRKFLFDYNEGFTILHIIHRCNLHINLKFTIIWHLILPPRIQITNEIFPSNSIYRWKFSLLIQVVDGVLRWTIKVVNENYQRLNRQMSPFEGFCAQAREPSLIICWLLSMILSNSRPYEPISHILSIKWSRIINGRLYDWYNQLIYFKLIYRI